LYVELFADGTVPLDVYVSRRSPATLYGAQHARCDELELNRDVRNPDQSVEYRAWVKDCETPGFMQGTVVHALVTWSEFMGLEVEVYETFEAAYLAGLEACGALNDEGQFGSPEGFYTGPGSTESQFTNHIRSWWLVGKEGEGLTEVYGHVISLPID